MTQDPFFTICIPVYKSEKYVSYAVDDLLNQTFLDYECIVVDDKSPDHAIAVIERKVVGDKRFKIIKNRKNLGVSATRNKALKQARGKYVIFLDSDDRYDIRLLERVHHQIKQSNTSEGVDVVTWEFGGVGVQNEKVKKLEVWREKELERSKKPNGAYRPIDIADRIFQVNTNSMCVKCFRREHLLDIGLSFYDGRKFGEDALFSYSALCAARSVVAVPDDNILYYYRRDQEDSAMHTINLSDQLAEQLRMIVKMEEFLMSRQLLDVYRESFEEWVSDGVGSIAVRMCTVRAQRNASIDQQIQAIVNSHSWRFVQMLRERIHI